MVGLELRLRSLLNDCRNLLTLRLSTLQETTTRSHT